MKFIGIIPARYASSRFPGKPLAKIGELTMIERVYRQASKELDEVVVATDDVRIFDAVTAFGGKAVMTSESHRSGTDRCREAYANIDSTADVIINIQGAEPFIAPEQIAALKSCFDDPTVKIATLARRFDPARGFEALFDPNTPKVVIDNESNAIYFSRSIIPYVRNYPWQEWLEHAVFHTHVGLYAYTAATLDAITKLPQSSLELAESLEQLRWVQNGYKIRVAITDRPTIGIDTPEDLQAAVEYLKTLEGENA
ncbi:MAG: 3-deoxy-manno-octulosonate cytidylyltransferase [Muribaculaceae bacterium]|nr:3-deoxy-manno-octulosonate cytidylyltransferase [Muribaculaceae bacterium]